MYNRMFVEKQEWFRILFKCTIVLSIIDFYQGISENNIEDRNL